MAGMSPRTLTAVAAPRTVSITSVVFTGSVKSPTITVHGSGFGPSAPPADPAYTPAGNTAPGITYTCPSTKRNDGFDYGLSGLWILDQSATGFSAGRYDESLDELDCIGIRVLKYKDTLIKFRLGAAYAQYRNQYNWALNSGDSFTLEVLGTDYTGTVSYG